MILAEILRRIDALPRNTTEVSAAATDEDHQVAGSVQVGTPRLDVGATGGLSRTAGWFAGLRGRWTFGRK